MVRTTPCSICGKHVPSNTILRHERSHTPSYKCSHCDEAFGFKSSLARHMLSMHTPADQHPHVCPDCGVRFARRELLDAHASKHLESARSELQTMNARFTTVQTELQDARANMLRLQEESDRLSVANTLVNTLHTDHFNLSRPEFNTLRCQCGRYDSVRLGDLRRCTTAGCTESFHWVCAGYGRPLAPGALAPCSRCLATNAVPVTAYEDASNELILLDAYLAARGLRRDPVPADGLCLFAAVARVTGSTKEKLFKETMFSLSNYDFHGTNPTIPKSEVRQLQSEAGSLADRPLRMGARWNTRLMDFAPIILMERFGLACFEARGRVVREDPVDRLDAGGRICVFGKGIALEHYDAVVALT